MEYVSLTMEMTVFWKVTFSQIKKWLLSSVSTFALRKDINMPVFNGKSNAFVEMNQYTDLIGLGSTSAAIDALEMQIKYAGVLMQCRFIQLYLSIWTVFVYMIILHHVAF